MGWIFESKKYEYSTRFITTEDTVAVTRKKSARRFKYALMHKNQAFAFEDHQWKTKASQMMLFWNLSTFKQKLLFYDK